MICSVAVWVSWAWLVAPSGEQGRGFAVVAGQIQKLAEQSNESAQQITAIIELLIQETQRSVQTMTDVKSVIEKQDENVTLTEKAFGDVEQGIALSIEGIHGKAPALFPCAGRLYGGVQGQQIGLLRDIRDEER